MYSRQRREIWREAFRPDVGMALLSQQPEGTLGLEVNWLSEHQ